MNARIKEALEALQDIGKSARDRLARALRRLKAAGHLAWAAAVILLGLAAWLLL